MASSARNPQPLQVTKELVEAVSAALASTVTVALELFLKEKKSGTTAANAQPLLGGELISFQLACMQETVMEAVLVDVNGLAGMAEGLRASLEATEGARGQVDT